MAGTVKTQIPHSQQTMRNRTYNCQMRNLYYEKSNYQFRKLKKFMETEMLPRESELFDEFSILAEFLGVCLSYAKSSIFCSKSDKIASYAQDHYRGILQEEVLLVHFLDEQISSVKYMMNRIDTNIKIHAFANESVDKVNHILSNIDELSRDSEKDLRYFYERIEKRYMVGNKLFGILQELQQFQ